jgi:restriction endonuclease Mrr
LPHRAPDGPSPLSLLKADTTTRIPVAAIEYADSVTPRIILVDGKELAKLMIEHGVGVSVLRGYDIRRVDLDYFTGCNGAAER